MDIKLNRENRARYGELVAEYYLYKEIKDELRAFTEGFLDVIPKNTISVFDCEELELLIGGTPYIDIEDWRANTVYSGDYNEKHRVVSWFWEILQKLTQDQLKKLLIFCTGLPRVPLDGFK